MHTERWPLAGLSRLIKEPNPLVLMAPTDARTRRLKQHYITADAFLAGRMKRPRDGIYRVTHVRSGVKSDSLAISSSLPVFP